MTFLWEKMSVEEFADFERILGERIFSVNGTFWREVRPLFYRPLVLFQKYPSGSVRPPALSTLGGFQHAVPSVQGANSVLNFLMFQDAERYALDHLDANRKRQVRRSAREFVIRPVTDKNEFKESAYPVYLSFYERTQYRYGSQRRSRDYFSQWADALFGMSKAVVLGGYRHGRLGGVSVSLLVENTVHYAMSFCDNESLQLGFSDLMLHSIRESVATTRCAEQVLAGMYKGGNGLDEFYLLRGCTLVRQPSLLHLNPLTDFVIRHVLPGYYDQLKGKVTGPGMSQAGGEKSPSQDILHNHNGSVLSNKGSLLESEPRMLNLPKTRPTVMVKKAHTESYGKTQTIATRPA